MAAVVIKKVLTVLYNKILRSLGKIPQDAPYRCNTEQIVKERFQHVKTELDPVKLEQKIGCGQLEEVIKQAENELLLSRQMAHWKPWEPLLKEAPKNQWKWPI
ncbi:PREDICTED: NADH dehydrogenase [ubiquinone] 1 alpha subcomplex subunit 5-like isoform X2 [Priapulus caudatus]|uniref:NADH dehydrogenase [ubiquinone] 1 alpha subcomplex subunit 5-like isoform X2 n=1 Tax=Priapulus caudatus TaxID=37621 RepID=A0ABM1F5R7_PRICU|nr:PREDICTED: NADH dehydrogenase [ubiquinone] 1 alpha subcomplex subunit 5-like isoform X2 [Priapulus caudatus]